MDNLHTSRLSIDVLPNELLSHVLGFLDVSPPSATTSELVNEPRLNLTRATNAPLHAASLVSRRWRQAAKPLLFKHVQFVVQKPKEQRLALSEEIRPFLDFMVDDELAKNAASFTLIVHHKKIANILGGEHTPDGFASFWNSLFNVINPSVLLIVAPAQALGSLTSCHVHLEDEWTFDTPCHYLRLEQPSKGTAKDAVDQAKQFTDAANPSLPEPADTREPSENPRATSSTLFQIRPWTKLLLNEGSFIRAYATYEWWLRNPPSVRQTFYTPSFPNQASDTFCRFSMIFWEHLLQITLLSLHPVFVTSHTLAYFPCILISRHSLNISPDSIICTFSLYQEMKSYKMQER